MAKLKKQLPLKSAVPMIDEDLTTIKRQNEELESMNQLCMTQFNARIADLELSVKTELSSVPGTYPDEVSLLGQISRKHF